MCFSLQASLGLTFPICAILTVVRILKSGFPCIPSKVQLSQLNITFLVKWIFHISALQIDISQGEGKGNLEIGVNNLNGPLLTYPISYRWMTILCLYSFVYRFHIKWKRYHNAELYLENYSYSKHFKNVSIVILNPKNCTIVLLCLFIQWLVWRNIKLNGCFLQKKGI